MKFENFKNTKHALADSAPAETTLGIRLPSFLQRPELSSQRASHLSLPLDRLPLGTDSELSSDFHRQRADQEVVWNAHEEILVAPKV
jgi:hypothetical protein